jgi:outer membrane receptor protein involved in Fe transport
MPRSITSRPNNRIPFDSYNTQSVEITRGPNSLLFGLGTPAGIVNQSAAQGGAESRYQ